MSEQPDAINSIEWIDDQVKIIDQTYLPHQEVYEQIDDVGRIWEAIRNMRIRGAPAIGIAAAYGMYLGIREAPERSFKNFWVEVERIADYLNSARPTAFNLRWAIERIKNTINAHKDETIGQIKAEVLKTARTIHEEDKRVCKKIGEVGSSFIGSGANILTHCNTGSLATGKYGTAFSVIFHAHLKHGNIHVWVDETRPRLQGARLTTWELQQHGIPNTLIVDSAAAYLMKQNKVDVIVVGADSIAANGDVANKIGTYNLAVLAKEHGIPFYVAAPLSTIDTQVASGDDITIEERESAEVIKIGESHIAPAHSQVYNPAFDITENSLINGIITEKWVVTPNPDYRQAIAKLFE